MASGGDLVRAQTLAFVRRHRGAILAASATAVVLVAIGVPVARERLRDQPNLLALWRFERANAEAGGPVALLWSIETYNDRASFEGPTGRETPSALRVVGPTGTVGSASPMSTLDPAVNVSVCPERRPPKGASWWSGTVPEAMALQLRVRGETDYRVEVLVRDEWRPTILIDSGCRGVGRA